MRVTSCTASDSGHSPQWGIEKPNSTFERQYLVNVGSEVVIDGYGKADWLTDAGFFLVGGTPAVGDSYGAAPSSWQAVKNRYGFTITGPATAGSGAEQRATGRQEFANELVGKADSQIAKGSTGTFSIWWRNATTGAWEDSTLDVTATALAAIVPATPKFSQAAWRAGQWVVGPWEC